MAGNSGYSIIDRIGSGGMASIFRATQQGAAGFSRTVALKRMLPTLAQRPDYVERFINEAKVGSELSHPNIATVFDFGRLDDTYFIALELIRGTSVRQLLRAAQKRSVLLPLPVVLGVLRQLCDALDHVHTRTDDDGLPLGFVHRDISPSNLMLTETGHLKLIDFGVACAATSTDAERCRSVGKASYMSPETILGEGVDMRSDIFSACVVGWELLTSTTQFRATDPRITAKNILLQTINLPSLYRGSGTDVDELFIGGLARETSDRIGSAKELGQRIDRIASGARLDISPAAIARWLEGADQLLGVPIFASSRVPAAASSTPPAGVPAMVHDLLAPDTVLEVSPTSVHVAIAPPVAVDDEIAALDPFGDIDSRNRTHTQSSRSIALEWSLPPHARTPPRPRDWRMFVAGLSAAALGLFFVFSSSGSNRPTPAVAHAATAPAAADPPRSQPRPRVVELADASVAVAPVPKIRKRRAKDRKKAARTDDVGEQGEPSKPVTEFVVPQPTSLVETSSIALTRIPAPTLNAAPTLKTAAPQKGAAAKVIRPNQLEKVSGSVPQLRLRKSELSNIDKRSVSVKMCVGPAGGVTKVTLLGKLPSEARSVVIKSLRRWRFRPYQSGGKATSACFVKQLFFSVR